MLLTTRYRLDTMTRQTSERTLTPLQSSTEKNGNSRERATGRRYRHAPEDRKCNAGERLKPFSFIRDARIKSVLWSFLFSADKLIYSYTRFEQRNNLNMK